MVYKWLVSLLNFMEKCIHNFVWIGLVTSKNIISISLNRSCCLKKKGGLRVKNLCLLNEVWISKLAEIIHTTKEGVLHFFAEQIQ